MLHILVLCCFHLIQLIHREALPSPVILLVTKVAADLVHDGRPRQDVGLVLLLVVVALHDNDDPVGRPVRPQAVLPPHHVLLHRAFILFCILQ